MGKTALLDVLEKQAGGDINLMGHNRNTYRERISQRENGGRRRR